MFHKRCERLKNWKNCPYDTFGDNKTKEIVDFEETENILTEDTQICALSACALEICQKHGETLY